MPETLSVDGVRDYFVQALKETRAAATDYLRKRRIDIDTTAVMTFIDDLVSERAAS